MKGGDPAVLDACVLIPMPLADTLLRLAAAHLYFPRWTDRIMLEVARNLRDRFGLSAAQVDHRTLEMRRHFPDAWIAGYEDLIPSMKNHEKDRHVLAAAVRSQIRVIVTYNVKDFPPAALDPHGITAIGPGRFLQNLYQIDQAAVMAALERQAAAIRRPMDYLLGRLRVSVPGFVEYLGEKGQC